MKQRNTDVNSPYFQIMELPCWLISIIGVKHLLKETSHVQNSTCTVLAFIIPLD